jgi:hypothetical protein
LHGLTPIFDSIHPGGDVSGSEESSRLLSPRTMSRAPTVTLMIRSTVETVLFAPPKRRRSPEWPITAQVVKYPSVRAPALVRGPWELKNRMVRRSRRSTGGAIEPPMARMISLGRESLIYLLLAVVRSIRRRTGLHRF